MAHGAVVLVAPFRKAVLPPVSSHRAANDNLFVALPLALSPEARAAADGGLEYGAWASFAAAGAVLFASLIIGSSGSLLLTGSDAMLRAIEQAFVSLGLRALAGGLIAAASALGVAALWRNRSRAAAARPLR
jgi:hypothetical protein